MKDDFDSDLGEDMSNSIKSRGGISIKWENILPIIVIILVVVLVLFKTNILSGDFALFGGSKPLRILHIGTPSNEFRAVLNDAENRDLIQNPRFVNADTLVHNPYDRIKDFDVIILDQSNQTDKSISRTLGDAITSFVKKGGKLIVVLNSGIKRPNDISVMGWEATFGDLIPVGCENMIYGVPSCNSPITVNGVIYSSDESHTIMKGISRVPALDSYGLLYTTTFDLAIYGHEIAYLQNSATKKVYPAIVEKPLTFGKVIYFNYNPGLSNEIFVKTLQYLR
jgi:hypothetical protein